MPARKAACISRALVGVWLSLVEHLVRDEGVVGSNPITPTNTSLDESMSFHIGARPAPGVPGQLSGQKRRSGLPPPPDPENESPGAVGTATGADFQSVPEEASAKYRKSLSSVQPAVVHGDSTIVGIVVGTAVTDIIGSGETNKYTAVQSTASLVNDGQIASATPSSATASIPSHCGSRSSQHRADENGSPVWTTVCCAGARGHSSCRHGCYWPKAFRPTP